MYSTSDCLEYGTNTNIICSAVSAQGGQKGFEAILQTKFQSFGKHNLGFVTFSFLLNWETYYWVSKAHITDHPGSRPSSTNILVLGKQEIQSFFVC